MRNFAIVARWWKKIVREEKIILVHSGWAYNGGEGREMARTSENKNFCNSHRADLIIEEENEILWHKKINLLDFFLDFFTFSQIFHFQPI